MCICVCVHLPSKRQLEASNVSAAVFPLVGPRPFHFGEFYISLFIPVYRPRRKTES